MSGTAGSGSGAEMPPQSGPPYLPTTAALGGQPTVGVDTPVSAVLLFLFVCGAAVHMTTLQLNLRRDHKFLFSGLLFGFCMARITALTMRMVWASHPTDVSIAIAANIFTAAGVILLFIVNLFFTQRLLRAWHPSFGWHPAFNMFFRLLIVSIVLVLIMLITCTVQSFYTLDGNTRRIDRDVQLFGSTYFASMAFLPLPAMALARLVPRAARPEKFGSGRFRTKVRLLVFTSLILSFGAAYRAGISYEVHPISDPQPYHHKAAYYCVNYVIELIVVFTYAAARFDRRFHVPNGASAPGHYAGGAPAAQRQSLADRVGPEADVFGEGESEAYRPSTARDADEWEKRARKELSSDDNLVDGAAAA